MKNKKKPFLKKWAALFLVSICAAVLFLGSFVYADEKVLPSGISYDQMEEEIQNYIKESEATTAGFAYDVFDLSGDIARGFYGYSDKENGTAVDEDTVFEWGSGTKMIVWVSVMQMVEQGKIDLDADISEYLPEGFLTNRKYDDPITMLNLMTHTAGFQDEAADMSVLVDGYLTNLEDAISAHKPAQIYKPGTLTGYSNWGTSLAAYIVQRVSGMEYTDYVHQYIFEPLGMDHSAISSNLSDNTWVKEQREKLKCYSSAGELLANSFYYSTLYPCGGCVTTAGDYQTFAKALLSRSDKLMKEETWDLMYTPTDYFGDSDIAKNCHGLWCVYFSVPTIGHLGKTTGCSSYLLIDPENGVGAALICNQGSETRLTEDMMSLIFGDYKTSEYYVSDAVPEGTFRCSKMVEKGPFKITGLLGSLSKDLTKEYWTLSESNGETLIELSYMDYIKIPDSQVGLESFLLGAGVVGVILLVLLVILRLILGIIRLLAKHKKEKYPLKIWSVLITILSLAVPFLFMVMLSLSGMPSATYVWVPKVMIGILAVLILLSVYGLVRNLISKIPLGSRIYNFFVLLVSVVVIVNIFYWNLYMFWEI